MTGSERQQKGKKSWCHLAQGGNREAGVGGMGQGGEEWVEKRQGGRQIKAGKGGMSVAPLISYSPNQFPSVFSGPRWACTFGSSVKAIVKQDGATPATSTSTWYKGTAMGTHGDHGTHRHPPHMQFPYPWRPQVNPHGYEARLYYILDFHQKVEVQPEQI